MCSAVWFSMLRGHRSEGTSLITVAMWLSSLLSPKQSQQDDLMFLAEDCGSHPFPPLALWRFLFVFLFFVFVFCFLLFRESGAKFEHLCRHLVLLVRLPFHFLGYPVNLPD